MNIIIVGFDHDLIVCDGRIKFFVPAEQLSAIEFGLLRFWIEFDRPIEIANRFFNVVLVGERRGTPEVRFPFRIVDRNGVIEVSHRRGDDRFELPHVTRVANAERQIDALLSALAERPRLECVDVGGAIFGISVGGIAFFNDGREVFGGLGRLGQIVNFAGRWFLRQRGSANDDPSDQQQGLINISHFFPP